MPSLQQAFESLLKAYGPQQWWPADSPLEVIVGAILTQNTNWKNVERALDSLRDECLLSVDSLRSISTEELAELIRPAGYYRQKARRVHNFLRFLDDRFEGSIARMFTEPLDSLRQQLLSINGIGPETADSILLYAGNLPTFVVDAYTARVFVRHGWIESAADYQTIKSFAEDQLACQAELFNEFHALIVQVGKQHCGLVAKCESCPLQPMLPIHGPLDANP